MSLAKLVAISHNWVDIISALPAPTKGEVTAVDIFIVATVNVFSV